jgi:energy-coupling factor transport system ATP-binding protein
VSDAADPLLDAARLSFRYPDGTVALRGIDLQIRTGERVAIIGQNGSGKSSLVRHFNGLLRASEGEVRVGGQPVGTRHVAQLARTVGMAFQNPDRQIFAGRVSDEVAFGPRNLGVTGRALEARVAESLDAVGLTDRVDANPYDLGYSQRKLLGLASILAMRTPVLVLDEPTTGQDARGTGRVRAIVEAVAAEGRTVVAISHDMRFVAEAFERIVVMREGTVILDGRPEEVFAERHWEALGSTFLDPPLAARVGVSAGVGSTPTEASLVEALRARS